MPTCAKVLNHVLRYRLTHRPVRGVRCNDSRNRMNAKCQPDRSQYHARVGGAHDSNASICSLRISAALNPLVRCVPNTPTRPAVVCHETGSLRLRPSLGSISHKCAVLQTFVVQLWRYRPQVSLSSINSSSGVYHN